MSAFANRTLNSFCSNVVISGTGPQVQDLCTPISNGPRPNFRSRLPQFPKPSAPIFKAPCPNFCPNFYGLVPQFFYHFFCGCWKRFSRRLIVSPFFLKTTVSCRRDATFCIEINWGRNWGSPLENWGGHRDRKAEIRGMPLCTRVSRFLRDIWCHMLWLLRGSGKLLQLLGLHVPILGHLWWISEHFMLEFWAGGLQFHSTGAQV